MSFWKIILTLAILFLAAVGAFMLFGLVAALLPYLVFFGVVALAGFVAFKALKGSGRAVEELEGPDAELERARRALEEVKRRQLTK